MICMNIKKKGMKDALHRKTSCKEACHLSFCHAYAHMESDAHTLCESSSKALRGASKASEEYPPILF